MHTDSHDAQGVRSTVARYIEATYRGDVEALRACFHPSAIMSGRLGETLLAGSPEPFFRDMGSMPSMESTGAPYVAETTSVEVVGSVASVRVDEVGFAGDMAFTNYFHLLQGDDGTWLIISKAFATRVA